MARERKKAGLAFGVGRALAQGHVVLLLDLFIDGTRNVLLTLPWPRVTRSPRCGDVDLDQLSGMGPTGCLPICFMVRDSLPDVMQTSLA